MTFYREVNKTYYRIILSNVQDRKGAQEQRYFNQSQKNADSIPNAK